MGTGSTIAAPLAAVDPIIETVGDLPQLIEMLER
jgi:hypothetical protein